uniref:VHS domain-containing protein n=1 Tax=Oryza meridionalis TaxID=40149 RepID=A0A0E0BZE7_9ORYZ
MAGSMVDRATSDMLIGPDWAKNMEICDICNRDPGQSKDVVKALKKRIGHKNPKVQILALTLLETAIKNCGDIFHMHVAERDVLHEMVKIVKKKSDQNVKEKVLTMIDTWQEAFGGPRARYPQYYAAYHDLVRAGAAFPKRSDRPAPLFNGQSPAGRNMRSPDQQDEAESSAGNDFPALRDEELMSQGLALNDDLQRVLAKHDAIAAGIAVRVEKKPKSLQALVDTEDSMNQDSKKEQALVDIEDPTTQETNKEPSQSEQSPFEQLALPAPPVSNGSATPAPKSDLGIDLLSWDDNPSTTENSLALVPVTDPVVDSTPSQNALAIVDIFSQNNTTNNIAKPADPFGVNSSSTLPGSQPYNAPTQHPLQAQQQPQQVGLYPNGGAVNPGTSYPTSSGWNGQIANNATPPAQQTVNYDEQSGALPPPPWEAQSAPSGDMSNGGMQSHPVSNGQFGGMPSLPTPSNQMGGMQPLHPQMNQMGGPQAHPMYNNQQPGAMQPSQPAVTQMQSGFANQFGSMPPHSMPGMQFPGMQPSPMPGAQPVMLYAQPMMMPGMQFAAMPQPRMYGPQMSQYRLVQQQAAQYYSNSQGRPTYYAGMNDLSQKMYGLSMQDSSYMGMNSSSYSPSSSSSMGQPIKPSKPEDKLFGDLLSIAKTKQNKA